MAIYEDETIDSSDDRPEPATFAGMIQIEPFDAETDDDEKLRVVGVVADPRDGTFDFIAIKTLDNGEMYPTREASVWPVSKKS